MKNSKIKGEYMFGLLIVIAIIVAFIMITISMFVYNASGAAQLDLSRPGYEKVRAEADDPKIQDYKSSGPLDDSSIREFNQLFDSEYEKIQNVDVFGGDPLGDHIIGL